MAVQELPAAGQPRERSFRANVALAPFVAAIVLMIVAFALAALIAGIANRLRLLTVGGAVAATLTGGAAVFAGLSWAILLLFFFTTSTALSRWRAADRNRLLAPLVAKEGPRDAVQVLANGVLFALAALLSTRGDVAWQAAAAGAIAAATSDTWSTEVGTVLGGTPIGILSGRQVVPGTSGGITMQGTLAALTGAFATALITTILGWPVPLHAVFAGGIGGSIFDSVLGSAVQERRWCQNCGVQTERRIHSCGTSTVHRGGIQGCNNDVVNLMATIAGAVITWRIA